MQPILAHLTVHWHWYAVAALLLVEAWLGVTPRTEAASTLELFARVVRRLLLAALGRSPAAPTLVRDVVEVLSQPPHEVPGYRAPDAPTDARPKPTSTPSPGAPVTLAILLALGGGVAHAQIAGPESQMAPPPPRAAAPPPSPSQPAPVVLYPLALGSVVLGFLCLVVARRYLAILLLAGLAVGSSGCASWRNDAKAAAALWADVRATIDDRDARACAIASLRRPLPGAPQPTRVVEVVEVAAREELAPIGPPPVILRVESDPPAVTVESVP